MKKEIWKDIPGYEGLYQISDFGRVKSLARKWGSGNHPENILKPYKDKDEYLKARLSFNRKTRTFSVHRLILLAFVGESYLQCNHKNGIKYDNRLENLEYCTISENRKHAYATGLQKGPIGEKCGTHKLIESQVYRIKWIKKNVKISIGYWTKLAKALNVSMQTISSITTNKNWKHIEV